MSGQIAPDGQVIPPLNITQPAPVLNLRGFKWGTVDEKIHGPQSSSLLVAQIPGQQVNGHAAITPLSLATAAAPAQARVPAPQLPPTHPASLPTQLPEQLGIVPGRAASALPGFPLTQFHGAYAGNGFNLIWRPRGTNDKTTFNPNFIGDNILQLSLTTEQLTFGDTIGEIPNRGLNKDNQQDIFLAGFPYLQTVQDVTNTDTGKGDSLIPIGIHFEPGMFLNVPRSDPNPLLEATVVRMASIPHGTTINAQGLVPAAVASPPSFLGGLAKGPEFDVLDTTPFTFNIFGAKQTKFFKGPMDVQTPDAPRIPQNLQRFSDAKTITNEIIKNPNVVLQNAIKGLDIVETIRFDLSTGPSSTPGGATFNGGGTANIAFLAGTQTIKDTTIDKPVPAPTSDDTPNAHAAFMKVTYFVEVVKYSVRVPQVSTRGTLLLRPDMPPDSTAPTPVFAVTTPEKGVPEGTVVHIHGVQIQSSQTVNLNFAGLSWPHVSVSTLVPVDPQPFVMT